MKGAVLTALGTSPVYGDFPEPSAAAGLEVIAVHASALSHLTKARALGAHYSSDGKFPSVAGVDGVGIDSSGRRVYFVLPQAPYGALAEKSLVRPEHCISVPDNLGDVVAAAVANPGMSVWGGLIERAQLKRGETVLVNGATGTAGRLAVQLAKHLGAGRVIGTGRDEDALRDVARLGADAVVSFKLGSTEPEGAKRYERALLAEFERGIDVVIDYLWGESARTVIVAIARAVEDGHAVRFVHVGGASGEDSISLPGAALRSSVIELMGSGLKSVPVPKLLAGIGHVFEAVGPAKLEISTRTVPLAAIQEAWASTAGQPRVVVTIP